MKHSVLCVDDEVGNLDALERVFRKKYEVHKAISAAEGLAILKSRPISLIVSDQRMPSMTGVEFLEKSLEIQPDSIRMLLTGYADIESVIDAINKGSIYRYITKPWDPADILLTVDKAIEKYQLRNELKEKNAALKLALDELKSLDTTKSQFMILINHELKTPLTGLLSFLELLGETNLDIEQKKYHSRITTSADRLKEIIFDVLELTQAELGITKVEKRKIETEPFFKMVTKNFEESAKNKGQVFETHFSAKNILADETLVKNVLGRVVANAIRFGDEKSKIEMHCLADSNDKIKILVKNSGETIPAEMVDKILKPFSINENIMNHSKGLGLGLSLCQALLKRHQSKLEIKSQNRATEVSFHLDIP